MEKEDSRPLLCTKDFHALRAAYKTAVELGFVSRQSREEYAAELIRQRAGIPRIDKGLLAWIVSNVQ
ncbi:Putative uncharacterized protein [Mesorhizobium loti]|nr:Putative uncharacterized protein [Mesorhizobium loti]